jgi:hypothetical protein
VVPGQYCCHDSVLESAPATVTPSRIGGRVTAGPPGRLGPRPDRADLDPNRDFQFKFGLWLVTVRRRNGCSASRRGLRVTTDSAAHNNGLYSIGKIQVICRDLRSLRLYNH